MSKDFYSNDHTIQTGAPGSGGGNLKLKTEGDCNIDSIGNLSTFSNNVEIFGVNGAEINSNGNTIIYGDNTVSLESGDGANIYLDTRVEFNRQLKINDGGGADITGDVEISGNIVVDGEINGDTIANAGNLNITTTNGGDISISATGVSAPLGNGNINLTSSTMNLVSSTMNATSTAGTNITVGTDLVISAGDDITITGGTSDVGNITIRCDSSAGSPEMSMSKASGLLTLDSPAVGLVLDNTFTSSGGYWSISTNSYVDFYTDYSTYNFRVRNTSSSSSTDIMKISFDNINTPTYGNNWIQFVANNIARGAIQGASSGRGNYVVVNTGAFGSPVDPDDEYALTGNGNPFTTDNGNVQYASGNEDFGEWIPIGDEAEWGITEEIRQELAKASTFPVQEGVTLYIRDSKVWKSGPGRGMVVTNRAIVVGNQNFKEDGKLGIIMSFTGQVPTFVEGTVEDGDLLVPMEGTNHCKAINPDQVSFQDYRKAVGTAWGKKLTTEVGLVNCAIGIK